MHTYIHTELCHKTTLPMCNCNAVFKFEFHNLNSEKQTGIIKQRTNRFQDKRKRHSAVMMKIKKYRIRVLGWYFF